MAGPNEERDPRRNRSRSEELHDAARREREQREQGGDPRLSAPRGTVARPYHVIIDDAADKFFDSFRAPTPEEGPQRPGEGEGGRHRRGSGTGEEMFRAGIEGSLALAEAAHQAATQMRSQASMVGGWTADMGRYTSMFRIQQEQERVRIDQVLTRIEAHYDRLARAAEGDGSRRRGGQPPAGPSGGPPIPDLDNPNPDGSFPPAPPGGGGGGGPTGGNPNGPQGPPQGPGRPPPHNRSYANLRTHMGGHGGFRHQLNTRTGEALHQAFGQGTNRSNTIVPVKDQTTGEISHFEERDATGALVRSAAAGTPEGQSMARSAMRMFTVSRMAGAIARGAGIGGAAAAGAGAAGEAAAAGGLGGAAGAVAGVATKAIPIVGWALAAVDLVGKAFHFAQDQRAKNAYYQSIYGGANTEGFGQRAQEEGFSWGQFFTTGLKDEEARKLFKGVSSMGFKDSQRGDMLDFAQKQYKNMGMSVDQSLQAINIAAAGGNTSLVGLEQALNRVNLAARSTGQSAEVLRDKFLNTFGQATMSGFGVSAAQVAGIATAAGPGSSRDLQGVDYTGAFSSDQQRFIAAQQGISYGQQVYNNSSGNVVPGLEQRDANIKQLVESSLSPSAKKALDDAIAKAGGKDKVASNNGLQASIGLELTKQIDPGVVKAMADVMIGKGALQNVPEDKIGEWLVRNYVGAGSLAAAAKTDEANNNERKLGPDDQTSGTPWLGAMASPAGSNFVSENHGTNIFSSAVRSKNSALDAYDERQKKTGMTDPAMEAFIQATGHYSEIGVEVQTKDGKKVVGKDEAIKYFGDQIADGTARIVNGPSDLDGKTVGEITGIKQKDYSPTPGQDSDSKDDAAPKDVGVSEDDWRKSHDTSYSDTSANTASKVTVDLSDDAKKLLKIVGPSSTENSQVEGGAASGLPPSYGGN